MPHHELPTPNEPELTQPETVTHASDFYQAQDDLLRMAASRRRRLLRFLAHEIARGFQQGSDHQESFHAEDRL